MIDIKENTDIKKDEFEGILEKELGSYNKYFDWTGCRTNYVFVSTLGLPSTGLLTFGMKPFKDFNSRQDRAILKHMWSLSFQKIDDPTHRRWDTHFGVYFEVRVNLEDPVSDNIIKHIKSNFLKHFPATYMKEERKKVDRPEGKTNVCYLTLAEVGSVYLYTFNTYEGLQRSVKFAKHMIDIMKKLAVKKRGVLKV